MSSFRHAYLGLITSLKELSPHDTKASSVISYFQYIQDRFQDLLSSANIDDKKSNTPSNDEVDISQLIEKVRYDAEILYQAALKLPGKADEFLTYLTTLRAVCPDLLEVPKDDKDSLEIHEDVSPSAPNHPQGYAEADVSLLPNDETPINTALNTAADRMVDTVNAINTNVQELTNQNITMPNPGAFPVSAESSLIVQQIVLSTYRDEKLEHISELCKSVGVPEEWNVPTIIELFENWERVKGEVLLATELIEGNFALRPWEFETILEFTPEALREKYAAYKADTNNDNCKKEFVAAFYRTAGLNSNPKEFLSFYNYTPDYADQSFILEQLFENGKIVRQELSKLSKWKEYFDSLTEAAGFKISPDRESGKVQINVVDEIADGTTRSKALFIKALRDLNTSREDEYNQWYCKNAISPRHTLETFNRGVRVDEEDFSGGEFLDKGKIGVVSKYAIPGGLDRLRGNNLNTSEKTIVVKTVRDLENYPDALIHTIEEASTIERIRARQSDLYPHRPLFVPDAILLQHFHGAPALAMEFLDQSNRLSIQKNTMDQHQFLDACIQYFELLTVLQHEGIIASDRKFSDFYYQPERNRLVVADWNVTSTVKRPFNQTDISDFNDIISSGLALFEQFSIGFSEQHPDSTVLDIVRKIKADFEQRSKDTLFNIDEIIQQLTSAMQ